VVSRWTAREEEEEPEWGVLLAAWTGDLAANGGLLEVQVRTRDSTRAARQGGEGRPGLLCLLPLLV